MDDRTLFRYKPGTAGSHPHRARLVGVGRVLAATEIATTRGLAEVRSRDVPELPATLEEKDVTRGRANSLRWRLSGQWGRTPVSDQMKETLDLCVACKLPARMPVGVDVSRMKDRVPAPLARAPRHPASPG